MIYALLPGWGRRNPENNHCPENVKLTLSLARSTSPYPLNPVPQKWIITLQGRDLLPHGRGATLAELITLGLLLVDTVGQELGVVVTVEKIVRCGNSLAWLM
jgi:hypothetical protein